MDGVRGGHAIAPPRRFLSSGHGQRRDFLKPGAAREGQRRDFEPPPPQLSPAPRVPKTTTLTRIQPADIDITPP